MNIERNADGFSAGRIRAFRPIGLPMWPQQIPFFRYVEVSPEEAQPRKFEVVTWEEFDAAKPRSERSTN